MHNDAWMALYYLNILRLLMQKESHINKFRTEFHKQIRRDNLNRLFNCSRQLIKEHNIKFQEEEFNKIYPNIDEQNFQQHLQFLLKYSYNQNYNYRLVIFGGYLYQYLLKNRTSTQALQMLQALSQFEQLQIPQTQELVDIFIENISSNSKTILAIIANLLQYYKYCSALRDYLLEKNFVSYIQMALSKISKQISSQQIELQRQLFVYILCSVVSSHPLIDEQMLNQIIIKILSYLNDYDLIWPLINSLHKLMPTIQQNNTRFLLIYNSCNNVFLKNFYNYQQEIINILYFCIKSHIIIDSKFHPLFVKSLTSSSSKITQKTILICQLLTKQKQIEMYESGVNLCFQKDLLNNMMKIYQIVSENFQIKIIKIVKNVIFQYVTTISQVDYLINRYNLDILELSNILKTALQSRNYQLSQSAIDLILCILHTIQPQPLQTKACFIESFQQNGIFQNLTNLQMQNKQLKQKIQYILSFQKNRANL